MANGAAGPGGSRVPAGGKVIHRISDLTEAEAAEAYKELEVGAGLRCGGCGERVSTGFEFVVTDAKKIDGRIKGDYQVLVACPGRDGCGFAGVLAERAVAMREVKQRFLDTPEMRKVLEGILERARGGGGDGGA